MTDLLKFQIPSPVKSITIANKSYQIILFADEDGLENHLYINKIDFQLSKDNFDTFVEACESDNEEALKALVVEKLNTIVSPQ